MNERKISWQSHHLDPSDFNGGEKDEILDGLDPDDEDDELIKEEILHAPKLMESPWGLVEVSNAYNPLSVLSHWMLHSNFNITEDEFVITNFVEGVSSLSVVSRYSMVVGFAPMFNEADVKREIEQKLINISDYPKDLLAIQKDILLMDSH